MNRSRSVAETSVGLFAFLDVLMSTMGSLILVLMIVTPKIRQENIARAARAKHHAKTVAQIKPAPRPVAAPPPVVVVPRKTIDLNRKVQAEVAELSRQADSQHRNAADSQAALASAKQRLEDTRAKLQDLDRQLAQIRKDKDTVVQSVAQLSTEGVEIESQLANSGTRLRKIRGLIADASSKYTFVAYDGVSGTTRRPILIECTDEHIKFLQEGISLSSADVTGFTPAYNPLLAGAQALVDYWSTHSAPSDPKPYVLIVVRPKGSIAYYVVRRLLELLRDPFGYELLNDDQNLNVPPPVPEAVAACREAIDKALANRDGIFQQALRGGMGRGSQNSGSPDGTDQGPGNSPRRGGRSSSPFDDPSSRDSLVAATKRGGPAASDPSLKDGSGGSGNNSATPPGQINGGAQTGTGAGQTGPAGQSVGGDQSGVGGQIGLSGQTGPAGSGGQFGVGGPLGPGNQTGPGGPLNAPGRASVRDQAGGTGPTSSGGTGDGQSNLPGGQTTLAGKPAESSSLWKGMGSGPNSAEIGSAFGGGGAPAGGQSGSTAAPGGLAQPDDIFKSGTFPQAATGSTGQTLSPPGGNGLPSSSSGSPSFPNGLASSASGPGSSPGGLPSSSDGSSSAGSGSPGAIQPTQPGTQMQPSMGQGTMDTGAGNPGSGNSSSGGQSPSQSPGLPSLSGMDGEAQPSVPPGSSSDGGSDGIQGLPSVPGGGGGDGDSDGTPTSRPAQHRWGMASPKARIGFERDVTIHVGGDRIIVGEQPPIPWGRGETSEQLGRAVIASLHRDARSWGRPPENFYWVPNIKFVISPGGNIPYERIRIALEQNGLVSSVDYSLDAVKTHVQPAMFGSQSAILGSP